MGTCSMEWIKFFGIKKAPNAILKLLVFTRLIHGLGQES